MSIFKPNFSPGKGVPDREENDNAFVYAVKTYFRHFIELMGLNFFYFVFSLVAFVVSYFITSELFWWSSIDGAFLSKLTVNTSVQSFMQILIPRVIFAVFCVFVPIIQLGPLHCGISYVARNISRRKHTFVWVDLKDHAFANFKQGMATTVINLFVTLLFGVAFKFWLGGYSGMPSYINNILSGVIFAAFLIFLSINLYLYPMMVTYKMSVKELYFACYKLAFSRLWQNFLTIISIIIFLFLLVWANYYLALALFLTMLPITVVYVITFIVDRAVRNYEA